MTMAAHGCVCSAVEFEPEPELAGFIITDEGGGLKNEYVKFDIMEGRMALAIGLYPPCTGGTMSIYPIGECRSSTGTEECEPQKIPWAGLAGLVGCFSYMLVGDK